MPVLVTGGEHALGRAIVAALARGGGEVRAFLDPEDAPPGTVETLRGAGVKTARGGLADEELLETALEGAHTLVHAAADPMADPAGLADGVASAISAALSANVRRLVLVSHLGADPESANAWLAALGEAEALVADAPLPSVLIRRALTYGLDDALTHAVAEAAAGADPDALHAPVWIDDLAAAAVVAADARDAPPVPHLVVSLGGPRMTSLSELIALLGGQIPANPETATMPDGSALPPHLTDLLSRDLVPDRDAPTAGTSVEVGGEQVRAEAEAAMNEADRARGEG
jgi:NADH dehydrogenase